MSTETPPRGYRHTRSVAIPFTSATSASSQNPQNPHHLDQNTQALNSQSETSTNQPGLASQSTTPPRTPRRDHQQPSQNYTNTYGPESGSKQKPRNKNRPKNVMTSPAVTKNGRNTPPLTSAQSAGISSSAKPINTPSTAAYAGPTFHASPAPSALPIPSFYSKSVPESPGVKGLKSVKESQVKKESSSPNNLFAFPPTNSQGNPFQREESPLDIFFRADREEKARARSASSTQTAAAVTGPFQPPIESPRSSQTPPALPTRNRPRQGHVSRMSANGMFAMELEGETEPGTAYGPAFSMPYAERIHAALASSQSVVSVEESRAPQPSSQKAEALKAYLFSGLSANETNVDGSFQALPPPPTSSDTNQQPSAHSSGVQNSSLPARTHHSNNSSSHEPKNSNYVPRTYGRSSGLRQEVTPTKTPTRTADRNSSYSNSPTPASIHGNAITSVPSGMNGTVTTQTVLPGPTSAIGVPPEKKAVDVQKMEDSLRRILKMDSTSKSGITGGNLPASVPN